MFSHAFCLIIAIKVPHLSLPIEKRISGRLKKWLYITKNIPELMIEIKILGSGCARCESLEKMTRKAVEELKLEAKCGKGRRYPGNSQIFSDAHSCTGHQ
jgi:hypothetical protein